MVASMVIEVGLHRIGRKILQLFLRHSFYGRGRRGSSMDISFKISISSGYCLHTVQISYNRENFSSSVHFGFSWRKTRPENA